MSDGDQVEDYPPVEHSRKVLQKYGWSVGEGETAFTDASGRTVWQVSCTQVGKQIQVEGANPREAWHRAALAMAEDQVKHLTFGIGGPGGQAEAKEEFRRALLAGTTTGFRQLSRYKEGDFEKRLRAMRPKPPDGGGNE